MTNWSRQFTPGLSEKQLWAGALKVLQVQTGATWVALILRPGTPDRPSSLCSVRLAPAWLASRAANQRSSFSLDLAGQPAHGPCACAERGPGDNIRSDRPLSPAASATSSPRKCVRGTTPRCGYAFGAQSQAAFQQARSAILRKPAAAFPACIGTSIGSVRDESRAGSPATGWSTASALRSVAILR